MTFLYVSLAVLFVLWALAHAKTSRPDGELIKKLPAYRRMLIFSNGGRNYSVVYFDRKIRAEKLEAYIAEAKEKFGGSVTHAIVAACNIGLAENPRMNQFVKGNRLYRRKGRWVSFSMKRVKLNKKAKLSAVKKQIPDGETFRELCERINDGIQVERSGERTASDKEFDALDLLPRPVLAFAVWLVNTLDHFNLLPAFWMEGDAMYTSMFVANLGSLGMNAGYHHLYEYGTSPLFLMVGQVNEEPVIEDGQVVKGRVITLRFSYDERISDGLNANYGIESVARVLEDPYTWLGCLKDDGSDTHPMWPHGRELDLGMEKDAGYLTE